MAEQHMTDTERLNWLQANVERIFIQTTSLGGWQILVHDYSDDYRLVYADDIRDVIDAAMKMMEAK